jgi:hypothetical protein
MTKPYLDFAGSYDCIAPYAAHQLPMYDSSASPCKVLVEINGASHCQFGAGNFQCNLGEGVSGCASPPTSRTSQINTTLGYLYPFLKYYLREDTTAKTAFDNVYTTDAVNTKKRSCNAVQTDISEHIDKTLSIYPNPVTDQLHIESIDKITSIKIIDLMGRAVVSTTGSEHTIIDISSLAGGIYQVQLSDQEGKTRTKRINKRP